MAAVRYKGSSLIEVVVSMTLASMILSFGAIIYLNIGASLNSGYKDSLQYESRYHLDSLGALRSLEVDGLVSYTTTAGLEVEFLVESYDDRTFPNAWLLTCVVTDSLNNAAESTKIIYRFQEPE